MDQDRFITLLKSTTQPHTDVVKKATAALKKEYYPKPEALVMLLQIATSHDDATLRQLASVQALGLAGKKWKDVPADSKPQIREHLLRSTFAESQPKVRHANARLVATIAKLDLPDGQWGELPGLVSKAAVSSTQQEREVGTYILYTVIDELDAEMMPRFNETLSVYQKTIKDPESAEVRVNTLLGLARMATIIEDDHDEANLAALQKLLPDMVSVLKHSIDAEDEETTMKAFETFQELIESDSRLLNNNFRDLVTFMAQVSSDNSKSRETRVQALHYLCSCVMFRKNRFQGLRLSDKFVQQSLEILRENADYDNGDEEDEETSIELATTSFLGIMSQNLAPSQVIGPLIPLFKQYVQSGDQQRKRAAIVALAHCCDGAPEFIDTQLPEIMPFLLQLLNDSDEKVRESATLGTSMLCEVCPETMGSEHEDFIAAIGKNLTASMEKLSGSPDDKVAANIISNCVSALDSIVDGIKGEHLKLYTPALVPALSQLFTHPDLKLKASAISAVGSLAEASGDGFLPYYKEVMNALSNNIQIKESEEDLQLRSMTVDAMGSIAVAIGADAFQPYVQHLMQSTEESLHLENNSVKESSYMFWGNLAKVYKEDFESFLPGVTQGLFASLEQEEEGIELETGDAGLVGQEVVFAGTKVKVVGDKEGDEDGMVDDDDDDDDDAWADIGAFSAVAEEKEIAMGALADVMTHTGRKFLPYYEKSLELMIPLADHHSESTQAAAYSSLFRAYAALYQVQPEEQQKWQPGLPLQGPQPSAELQKLGNVIMTSVLESWPEAEDLDVVMDVNRGLGETLKLTGPAIISGPDVLSKVVQTVTSLLQKKHVSQQYVNDDGEDEEDDEAAESVWFAAETSFEVVVGLANALGAQFAELFKIFGPPMMAFASDSGANQRAAAVGSIAESIRGMKGGVTPATGPLLKAFLHRMSDEDPLTKSNAAFAVGLLVQMSDDTETTSKAYGEIFSKLEPLLQSTEMRQLDNAAGCLSRMIMKNKSAVPLGDVLPHLIEKLPLKEDYEENEPVYSMIVQLYKEEDSTIQGLTPKLLPVLDHVMGPPEDQLTDETRAQLAQLAKYIHSKNGDALGGHAHLQAAASS